MKQIFTLILILFFANICAGQRLSFQQIVVDQGLSNANVFSINQDFEGRLMIGTFDGLNLYDGNSLERLNKKNGLHGKIVYDIKVIDSSLYILTNKELAIIKNGQKTFLKFETNVAFNPSNKIFVNKDHEVYIFSENNVLYVNKDNALERIAKGFQILFYYHNELFLTNDKRQYFKIKKRGIVEIKESDELFQNIHNFRASNPKIFLGLRNPVISNNIDLYQNRLKNLDENLFVLETHLDKKNRLWLSVYPYGLCMVDENNQIHYYNSKNGFGDYLVGDIYEDRYGNVWFSAYEIGLFKVVESEVEVSSIDPLAKGTVVGMATLNNDLYILTYDSKLYKKTDDVYKEIPLPKPVNNNNFHQIINFRGQIYAVTNNQIFVLENNNWRVFYTLNNIDINNPYTRLVIYQDELYFANTGGVNFIRLKTKEKLDLSFIKTFWDIQEVDGVLVISCSEGLYTLQKKGERYFSKHIYKNEEIVFFANNGKEIYFNTDEHGVLIYNIAKNTFEKLPKDIINNEKITIKVLDYFDNALWVGTTQGFYKIIKEGNDYKRINYNNDPFFSNLQISIYNGAKLLNGDVFFASNKGIFKLQSFTNNKEKISLPVVFNKYDYIDVNGEVATKMIFNNTLDTILFPNVAQLTIYFTQLNFSNKQNNEYKIQVEHLHSQPILIYDNKVVITNLKPGLQKVFVWGKNNFGEWEEKPSVLTFEVKEYFYYTWIFKVAIGLLIVAIFCFYKLWKAKQIAKKEAWKQKLREEEQAVIRQRTAEDFHDEIGNKLTRLGLLATVAEEKAKKEDIDGALQIIGMLKDNVQQVYKGAKDIIWSLQPQSEYLHEIVDKIVENITNSIYGTALTFEDHLTFLDEDAENVYHKEKVGTDVGRNLILVFKECINNIIKHSEAEHIYFDLSITENQYIFRIKDDGKGINIDSKSDGNGLKNMQQRANRINGNIDVQSNDTGTIIVLEMPRKKTK